MRVVLIVTLFPPEWIAGTEIATYNVAKNLAVNKHETHVVTSRDKQFPEMEKKDNFFIHRVSFERIRIIGVIGFWYRILLEIKKINPDIVHIQAISAALPGLFSKILLRKPYVIWAQGSDVYLPGKFTKLISKTVMKNASVVIALSEDMKRKINDIYTGKNIIILPNGIELEAFKEVYARKQYHKTGKTIIFVGTLRPVKGLNYLIKAMSIIHKKSSDVNLLIVGDGPDREKLQTLVQDLNLQDCIFFAGRVSNDKIPEYMAQADIFALPSLSESFGIVNIEAMASGLPIVTTNVGGLPEIVKNGENGFVVESKNPEAFAEKILLILNNSELEEKISERNREKAKEYSWDKVVEKLICIYKQCLNTKKLEKI